MAIKAYHLVQIQNSELVEHIGCNYAKIFPNKGIGDTEYLKVLKCC